MNKQHHTHTYELNFLKNEKRKKQICYLGAVKFRQKPFLQAGGVPARALPYALWCVFNNVGISSIKIDKLSQGCRTGGATIGDYPCCPLTVKGFKSELNS